MDLLFLMKSKPQIQWAHTTNFTGNVLKQLGYCTLKGIGQLCFLSPTHLIIKSLSTCYSIFFPNYRKCKKEKRSLIIHVIQIFNFLQYFLKIPLCNSCCPTYFPYIICSNYTWRANLECLQWSGLGDTKSIHPFDQQ